MNGLTARDLNAPYPYVVSEEAIRHVRRLIRLALGTGTTTSVSIEQVLDEPRRSILELEGLGMEVWDGVDPQQYIEKLRDEWNTR